MSWGFRAAEPFAIVFFIICVEEGVDDSVTVTNFVSFDPSRIEFSLNCVSGFSSYRAVNNSISIITPDRLCSEK